MATKVDDFNQKYLQPVKNWWQALAPARRRLIMIVGPLLLVLLIGLVIWLNYQPYAVLYRNLDLAEAGQIIASLEEKGVALKTQSDSTILVPENQVAALKMQLAMEGYPKNSLSYDFYIDNAGAMATDSDRRTFKVYQMNNRLQESIKTISGVKDAIVTISLPENNGYVLKTDTSQATASVLVTMSGAEPLSNAQVNGIKQLVSKGVIGMLPENVAVIDGRTGEEMGGDSNSVSSKANDRMAIEKEIDKNIEEKVLKQLQPLAGSDGIVQVVATSRVNTDNMLTQSKVYTPMNEESETGVTSQENHALNSDDGSIMASGVPGAESNAQVPTYPANTGTGGGNNYSNQWQKDYKVNETTQEVQRGDIVLESLKVSVVIQSSILDEGAIDDLTDLVATTANVEYEDVYIYMRPIEENQTTGERVNLLEALQQNWWILIVLGILLLIVIVVLLIVSRKKKQKRIAEELEAQKVAKHAAEAAAAKAKLQDADFQPKLSEEETKQQMMLEQVRNFAGEHPEVAAQIIRTWLKGDE